MINLTCSTLSDAFYFSLVFVNLRFLKSCLWKQLYKNRDLLIKKFVITGLFLN